MVSNVGSDSSKNNNLHTVDMLTFVHFLRLTGVLAM